MKVKRQIAVLGLAVVTALALSSAASAADDTDVQIIGGGLTITNMTVPNFANVTLDGTAKATTTTAEGFSVTDARGTGAGWHVNVNATQFCKLDGVGAACDLVTPRSLPTSSLSVPTLTVAKADATSSAVPTVTGGPYLIDGATVSVASAAANGSGMGSYNFSQGGDWTLTVPASAYVGTYRSTVTVSVLTGP